MNLKVWLTSKRKPVDTICWEKTKGKFQHCSEKGVQCYLLHILITSSTLSKLCCEVAHKRQRPGLHYLSLGKMRKEVKSTMWNLLTVRTVLYAPNDDIWYRNEGTQETQLYNLSRINMLSDSLPTWKNCTPNELIIKVLQWALFFVTGYLLSVQCSIPMLDKVCYSKLG